MSTIEFTLPELGEDVEAGTVVKLLVAEGDSLEAEQPVMEVEIDKATVELPAPQAGTVEKLAVGEGDEVKVGQLVMLIATEGAAAGEEDAASGEGDADEAAEGDADEAAEEDADEAAEEEPPAKQAPAKQAPAKQAPAKQAAAAAAHEARAPGETLPAGPAVRRLARLLGVDLEQVSGSGQRGRISVDDVHAYLKQMGGAGGGSGRAALPAMPDFSKFGEVRSEKISTFRKRTAEAMDRSWSNLPHVTNFDEADTTDLEAGRKQFRRANPEGPKVTMTVLIAKACAVALKRHPDLNSSVDFAAGVQHFKDYVHVGIAVDTDYGLLVPVLKDVDRKPVLQLADELTDLALRTRDKKVKPEELKGAGFTISNLGGIGGTGFTPIINWPQVAILGVARSQQRYVPGPDGQPVFRSFTPLCLSYDHRVVDGALAARFLSTLRQLLEDPTRLLFEV